MRRIERKKNDWIRVKGKQTGIVWDYKNDSVQVNNYIKTLRDLEYEIRYCRTRYPEEYRRLKLIKHNLMEEYEGNVKRIWNDQKAGTYFKKGEKFEPHQVVINDNLNMWDGVTRYTELISGETTDTFNFMGAGIGTTLPEFDDDGLEDEIVRVDIRVAGDLNSDGIVLKSTAAFPPGVPTNNISEFAGFDRATAGIMEYRVVVNPVLAHTQDVTFVQASHNTVFQAVRTE